MSEIIYSWKFSDKKERGSLWYIVAISVAIGLIIWGFFTKQYGMSFLILLVSGIFLFVENNSPDEIKVEISELGIKIGESFFEYSKINNFSYIFIGENPEFLRLNLNKKGIKVIDLRIDNKICEELKTILPNFMEESDKSELSFGEKVANFLKL